MTDFLEQLNSSGINLLQLVSRGNAIIAEILRLSEMIPSVYRNDGKQECLTSKLICDFSYFKSSELFESMIESSITLQEKDDEMRENYIDILTDFYVTFESIHKYIFDLNKYIQDLEAGFYIQQNIESIFLNMDGKQLMCEALYLFGVILLIVDHRIEGPIRERLIVSYYRYSTQRRSDSSIDDVCNLLRSTGYSLNNGKKPVNYPEEYFKRVKINSLYLSLVIGRLRSDDIYNQLSSYPYPEHRSVAMSNQAAMLYVVLYFSPDILHDQYSNMREIVDKFFSDNYVISVYMGITVNLIEVWNPFKAAKQALNNTLDLNSIRKHSRNHINNLNRLLTQISRLLKEGVLNEQFVLDSTNKLIQVIRECNVTLRWLMLHSFTLPSEARWVTSKRCKQIRDVIIQETKFEPLLVFQLLLNTSQLELKLKEVYRYLLNEKDQKWEKFKMEAYERIIELVDVFSGNKPLTRIDKNASLQDWFDQLGKQISSLNKNTLSNRKIVTLIEALDETLDFHQLDNHMHVKQYLLDAKNFLHCMLKTSDLKEEVLITLQIIGDLSYAWLIIDSYTKYMQEGIQNDATLVAKLRATFLKLASALDLPLMRLNQASSPDLVPVSQYYSSELVSYVRKVLHIIPESMFKLVSRIIELQTDHIRELPTRLIKDQLKNFAKLDERLEVAKLTQSISLFTEGILMMKTTLVGIIKIDPKKLLEDGIRKELVQQVASALHYNLVFNPKLKQSEIVAKLSAIRQKMDGFRRSFEYIQDYVCIYGLKIWQEEITRIFSYNVEQECNAFMRHKVLDWESIYQSKTIPVPKFPSLDQYSVNFIGRLAREVLRITDPKTTIYVHQMKTWYDNKSRVSIVDPELFKLMMESIGTAGINGLDRLLSFMIVKEIQNLYNLIENLQKDKSWSEIKKWLEILTNETNDNENENNSAQSKQNATNSIKYNRSWPVINEGLLKIGQMQIIRCSLTHELSSWCKFQSRHLSSCLKTLNDALITEYQACSEKLLKEESPLLYDLCNHLEWVGISDPLSKIYVELKYIPSLDLIGFMLVIIISQKLVYSKNLYGLTCKKTTFACDGTPFIIGLLTFLRQQNEDTSLKFISNLGKYIISLWEPNNRITDFPNDLSICLFIMLEYARFGKLSKRLCTEYIPDYLLDQINSLMKT